MFDSGAVVALPLSFYQQLKPFPLHVVVHQVPRFWPYDVSRTLSHGGLVVKIPSSSPPRFVPPAEGTESCGWCGPLRRGLSQTAVRGRVAAFVRFVLANGILSLSSSSAPSLSQQGAENRQVRRAGGSIDNIPAIVDLSI